MACDRQSMVMLHQQVLFYMQEALLRGTRVSKTRHVLEWPTIKMVREVVI